MIMIHKYKFQQASTHRMKQKKVHKVIKVNHSLWLKLHIELNTKLRKKDKSKFEKYFFKIYEQCCIW